MHGEKGETVESGETAERVKPSCTRMKGCVLGGEREACAWKEVYKKGK